MTTAGRWAVAGAIVVAASLVAAACSPANPAGAPVGRAEPPPVGSTLVVGTTVAAPQRSWGSDGSDQTSGATAAAPADEEPNAGSPLTTAAGAASGTSLDGATPPPAETTALAGDADRGGGETVVTQPGDGILLAVLIIATDGDLDAALAQGLVTEADVEAALIAIAGGTLDDLVGDG